ncbi:MAG: aldehyde dehydrogenase family protein [Carboxydocellales bacterium]
MSEQEAIDVLVNRAEQARVEFLQLDQQQVDEIIKQMTLAGVEQYMELAKLAVEETKRGVFEDKCTKNLFATEEIYHSIKYNRTVGVISQNEEEDYYEVAEPVGVLAGITPVTNPTSTVMFKSLIAMKTRNPIIFSFHPGAQQCSAAAAKLMRHAAVRAGAPAHCIGWIEHPSIEATKLLMNHTGVAMVLATGGAGMVRSAYSTGKPALGVGPGNVPCYIEKTAHLRRAVNDLIMSKTFDNGMICASEQAVILDGEIAAETVSLLEANGCYFLKPEEIALVEQMATCEESCSLNADVVGRSALEIAQMAGITVPTWTKILVAPLTGVGPDYPSWRKRRLLIKPLLPTLGPR